MAAICDMQYARSNAMPLTHSLTHFSIQKPTVCNVSLKYNYITRICVMLKVYLFSHMRRVCVCVCVWSELKTLRPRYNESRATLCCWRHTHFTSLTHTFRYMWLARVCSRIATLLREAIKDCGTLDVTSISDKKWWHQHNTRVFRKERTRFDAYSNFGWRKRCECLEDVSRIF